MGYIILEWFKPKRITTIPAETGNIALCGDEYEKSDVAYYDGERWHWAKNFELIT